MLRRWRNPQPRIAPAASAVTCHEATVQETPGHATADPEAVAVAAQEAAVWASRIAELSSVAPAFAEAPAVFAKRVSAKQGAAPEADPTSESSTSELRMREAEWQDPPRRLRAGVRVPLARADPP